MEMIPILCYHKIGKFSKNTAEVAIKNFVVHMKVIKDSGYTTVLFEDIYNKVLPVKPIVITFDDCYESFLEHVYPVLQKYTMKAINFIPTNYIGDCELERHTSNEWELDSTERKHSVRHLIWPEIQLMSDLIKFECHGKSHCNLTMVSLDMARYEIVESKRIIEDRLNVPVHFFAYPYSKTNGELDKILIESGFHGSVLGGHEFHNINNSMFGMKRIMINKNTVMDRTILQQR